MIRRDLSGKRLTLGALILSLRAPVLASMLGVGVAAVIVMSGPSAEAKSGFDSAYGFERTWNAALRLVRVDRGLKITEKDDANGYILFDYKSSEAGNKVTSGSMEIIRGTNAGDPVHVVLQLPQMPRYHEQVMLDELSRKLRHEYGEPPTAKERRSRPPADAGAPDGE